MKVIRPTWTEVMEMDFAMASAVIPNLPNLDDGMAQALTGLLTAIAGKKNPHAG